MAIIVGLLFITAMIISATLIGGLINAHISLLNSDLSPAIALLIISAAALLIIVLLTVVIGWRLRNLCQIIQAIYGRSPLASRAINTMDYFINGLMAK